MGEVLRKFARLRGSPEPKVIDSTPEPPAEVLFGRPIFYDLGFDPALGKDKSVVFTAAHVKPTTANGVVIKVDDIDVSSFVRSFEFKVVSPLDGDALKGFRISMMMLYDSSEKAPTFDGHCVVEIWLPKAPPVSQAAPYFKGSVFVIGDTLLARPGELIEREIEFVSTGKPSIAPQC